MNIDDHILTLNYEPAEENVANWKSENIQNFIILFFWIFIGFKWFFENRAYFACHHPFFAFWIMLMIVVKSSLLIDVLRMFHKGMMPDDAVIYIEMHSLFWYLMLMGKIYKIIALWVHISVFMSILVFWTAFNSWLSRTLYFWEYLFQILILIPIVLVYIFKLPDNNPVIIVIWLFFCAMLIVINIFMFFMFLIQMKSIK